MNAKTGTKLIYEHLEAVLLDQRDAIVSKLIEKGCSPETAKKVAHNVWRELFDKRTKREEIRLSEPEKRMLSWCIDGSGRFDCYKKADVKRGKKLAALGYLDAETLIDKHGLEWVKYTTTETGRQQIASRK